MSVGSAMLVHVAAYTAMKWRVCHVTTLTNIGSVFRVNVRVRYALISNRASIVTKSKFFL